MTTYDGLSFTRVEFEGFDGGFCLHQRLPWTREDISFSDETDDILVLMSGCIYNRAELINFSRTDANVADPELIARLFIREGPGFVKRLNGDFAIFLLRSAEKKAYLFRDHIGIRPLAYSIESGVLCFSTDIIALSGALDSRKHIENEFLLKYFKYIDYRATPDRNVIKLSPAHFMEFSPEGVRLTKYWDPEIFKEDRHITHEKMLADIKTILWDAVRIRCENRFTAGAHVSSGLDSGIVAALARKEYTHQAAFYGFSWSPRDYISSREISYDERGLVSRICKQWDISPVFSEMSSVDFMRTLSSYVENQGFFSEADTLDQIKERNTNLIFSGWGGDEFISTGVCPIEFDLLRKLQLRTFFRRNSVFPFKRFVKRVLFCIVYPALGVLDRGTARSLRDNARYIKEPFNRSDRKVIRKFHFNISRHQLHVNMLDFYHLQNRCEVWMVNGYRKGVEYRYPLLDKRIVEYMLKVPSIALCATDQGRPVLRELGSEILPDQVRLNQSKNDPVYWEWMDGLFKSAAVELMEEVDVWETNSDLHFIDFALLSLDIQRYKESSPVVADEVLFRALVYSKTLHEFTKSYHQPDELEPV